MAEIFVNFNHRMISKRENVRYGSWFENHSYEYKHLSLFVNGWYEQERVTVDFKPEPGKSYYVVYIDYDTGDSFGTAYNNNDILGVYDENIIYEIENKLKNAVATKKYDVSITNGESFNLQSYAGYFERINGIHVVKLELKDEICNCSSNNDAGSS